MGEDAECATRTARLGRTPHRPTVLLVDDEPDILDSLSVYLKATMPGTDILTAPTAEDAIPIVKETPVDVVVSDLRMPGMDGLEFLQKVGKCLPRIGRILVTAFHEPELERRADEIGIGDLLWKPFEMADLRTAVGRALKAT